MSKTERVYKIEMLIRTRGQVSFKALLDELEVSRATLKRDLDYLRERLGSPIVYDRFSNAYGFGEGCRERKHELPGLWFTERELYSLLMAHQLLNELDSDGVISRHLQPLLERIHQMLGNEQVDARLLLKRVKIISPAKRPVGTQSFETVTEALLKRRRVRMRYLTRSRDAVGDRDVSPQRLVHHKNTWYLDGWCHRAEGLRRFSLDAIEQAEMLDVKARDVAAKTLEAEMDAGYGIYAGAKRHWATLSFAPKAARWVSREAWHPEQTGRWADDGRYELKLPYSDSTELVMDILRHGGQVSVVSPQSLRTLVRQRHQEALAANPE